MVRVKLSCESDFKVFVKNNVVAVGWSNVDFTGYTDVKELREAVHKVYYKNTNRASQTVGKNLNEIERFKKIKKGDYIIIPYYNSIVLAEAEDEELFSSEAKKIDLANQHKVAYRAINGETFKIPRNDLSEGLQRRLRVRGNTVSNLYEFKEEIEKIFQNKSYSYIQEFQEQENKKYEILKKELLKNIQEGRTNLQAGGIGLEDLVCEIMLCEGYDAKKICKNQFEGKGDADIQAVKEDAFMSKKIFVQVKHHKGYSDTTGIKQLIEVLGDEKYQDYEGCLVTSALVDDKVRQCARNNNISVIDGVELVSLIVDNLNRLSETTKRRLGICSIPYIFTLN